MSSPVRREARRYRRRIFAICAAIATIGFVVTAPVFLDRVEGDLETRVPDELADAGYPGLSASFSGQDGTLSCEAPLTDPEAARQAAYDIWGVRAIDLDRSCRVNTADPIVTSGATDETGAADVTDSSADASTLTGTMAERAESTPPTTTVSPSPATLSDPTFATIADAVAGSPQLSLLGVLLQEADLTAEFGDPSAEPRTLFAATDGAFEALPADVLAEIRENRDLLRSLVYHHATSGRLLSDDFRSGPVEMLDDSSLPLDADVPSLADATITVVDIDAGNGVVHMIDAVVFPDDFGVGPAAMAEAGAAFDGTSIGFTGTVATEAVRAALIGAVADGVEVVDELGVDPDTGVDADTGARMAALVGVVTTQLADAVVAFDGDDLTLTGTAASEAARDAVDRAAAEVDVESDVTVDPALEPEPEPEPVPDPAAGLETLLNAYVADNPILFQPSSALIADESVPAIDRIAALIADADGVTVTVEGHTDSDGDPDENLVLSRLRALSVERALIERGIADAVLEYEGFGSERPVLVDGVEDKAASRRVEFRVVTNS